MGKKILHSSSLAEVEYAPTQIQVRWPTNAPHQHISSAVSEIKDDSRQQ